MAEQRQSQISFVEISEVTWHGQMALKLENATLQVVVVPEMGAKIVSLFDKRNEVEWLAGPGGRPFVPASYGAVFTDQDMSGWDEMFPTINACAVLDPNTGQEILLPDHGEVWAIPWFRQQTDQRTLSFSVEGRALPYTLSRKIEFASETILRFSYSATNLSDAPISTLWAAHPQFISGSEAKVVLPSDIKQVCNVLPEAFGWGKLEELVDWPGTALAEGNHVRLDAVGGPELKQARKFYMPPEKKAAWITIVREPSQDWISLSWNPKEIPYLGLWVDEGYISADSVIAPEPATGFYDSLDLAIEKGRQMIIEPGKTVAWSLLVHVGDKQTPFHEA